MNTVTLNLPNHAVITVKENGDILIKMGNGMRPPIPNPLQFDPMNPANMWGGNCGMPYNPMGNTPQFQHPMSQPFPTYQPQYTGSQIDIRTLSQIFMQLTCGFNTSLNDLVDGELNTIKQNVFEQFDPLMGMYSLKCEYLDERVNTLVIAPLVNFTIGVKYVIDETTNERIGYKAIVLLGDRPFGDGSQDVVMRYVIGIKHDCVYISVNTVTKSAE